MRRLNIFFPVPAVAGLGILLALSSALTGCGRTETESDQAFPRPGGLGSDLTLTATEQS